MVNAHSESGIKLRPPANGRERDDDSSLEFERKVGVYSDTEFRKERAARLKAREIRDGEPEAVHAKPARNLGPLPKPG